MEKIEVCFIRLYPDNPEDALIITGIGARKRKGDKSKTIKDILYAYFSGERTAATSTGSNKISTWHAATPLARQAIMDLSSYSSTEPAMSELDKEALRKNLDELSDMLL